MGSVFVLAGSLASIVIFTLSYTPMVAAGVGASLWFGVFHIGTKLCDTMFLIPLEGWVAEVTPSSSERSSLWMWVQVAVVLGVLIGTVLPGIIGGSDCLKVSDRCVSF